MKSIIYQYRLAKQVKSMFRWSCLLLVCLLGHGYEDFSSAFFLVVALHEFSVVHIFQLEMVINVFPELR